MPEHCGNFKHGHGPYESCGYENRQVIHLVIGPTGNFTETIPEKYLNTLVKLGILVLGSVQSTDNSVIQTYGKAD